MSWSRVIAGNASEVAAKIAKWVDQEMESTYHNVDTKEVIKSHGAAGIAVANAHPGRVIVFRSDGHFDVHNGGNAVLSLEALNGG